MSSSGPLGSSGPKEFIRPVVKMKKNIDDHTWPFLFLRTGGSGGTTMVRFSLSFRVGELR